MEIPAIAPDARTARNTALQNAARELETTFLAEMLKAAKLGEPPEGWGGGAGEEHFASFLRQEQARQLVAGGGIGLSEILFNALKEVDNE
ncbi:rod-binding protein [Thalassococcus sp. CAU 1522]|uniref:Rod-binding protein n=2 Tax=Thalassococcus arenae TaxID=2851652 RepID=A0ABS6N5N7_9RHOB|nr:rod-binding protein [Thalassococcus arenae]MBV2359324.1 rod-binding protein [Thalassococcus arenae]